MGMVQANRQGNTQDDQIRPRPLSKGRTEHPQAGASMKSLRYRYETNDLPTPRPEFVPATTCQCTGTVTIGGVEYTGVRNVSCPIHGLQSRWIPQPGRYFRDQREYAAVARQQKKGCIA